MPPKPDFYPHLHLMYMKEDIRQPHIADMADDLLEGAVHLSYGRTILDVIQPQTPEKKSMPLRAEAELALEPTGLTDMDDEELLSMARTLEYTMQMPTRHPDIDKEGKDVISELSDALVLAAVTPERSAETIRNRIVNQETLECAEAIVKVVGNMSAPLDVRTNALFAWEIRLGEFKDAVTETGDLTGRIDSNLEKFYDRLNSVARFHESLSTDDTPILHTLAAAINIVYVVKQVAEACENGPEFITQNPYTYAAYILRKASGGYSEECKTAYASLIVMAEEIEDEALRAQLIQLIDEQFTHSIKILAVASLGDIKLRTSTHALRLLYEAVQETHAHAKFELLRSFQDIDVAFNALAKRCSQTGYVIQESDTQELLDILITERMRISLAESLAEDGNASGMRKEWLTPKLHNVVESLLKFEIQAENQAHIAILQSMLTNIDAAFQLSSKHIKQMPGGNEIRKEICDLCGGEPARSKVEILMGLAERFAQIDVDMPTLMRLPESQRAFVEARSRKAAIELVEEIRSTLSAITILKQQIEKLGGTARSDFADAIAMCQKLLESVEYRQSVKTTFHQHINSLMAVYNRLEKHLEDPYWQNVPRK